jgi:hypothetical protein
MENHWVNTVYRLMEIRPRAALLLLALCIATCATPGTSAEDDALQDAYALAADLPAQHPLRPYDATYKTSVAGLSITLQRSLSVDDNGHCRLTSEGSCWSPGSARSACFALTTTGDTAVLRLPAQRPRQPAPRGALRRGLGRDPQPLQEDLVRIAQGAGHARSHEPAGTAAPAAAQRPDTAGGHALRVADGRKVKDYRAPLPRRGGDRHADGLGRTCASSASTTTPERQSYVWIAPAWDYLMVRTVHVEDGTTTRPT